MDCETCGNDWLNACTCSTFYNCSKHGEQEIVDEDSGRGFAGGTIYFARLACGCMIVDESDDVRAAM